MCEPEASASGELSVMEQVSQINIGKLLYVLVSIQWHLQFTLTHSTAPPPSMARADQPLLGKWSVVSANRNSLIYDILAGISSEMLVEINNIKINNSNDEATSL